MGKEAQNIKANTQCSAILYRHIYIYIYMYISYLSNTAFRNSNSITCHTCFIQNWATGISEVPQLPLCLNIHQLLQLLRNGWRALSHKVTAWVTCGDPFAKKKSWPDLVISRWFYSKFCYDLYYKFTINYLFSKSF